MWLWHCVLQYTVTLQDVALFLFLPLLLLHSLTTLLHLLFILFFRFMSMNNTVHHRVDQLLNLVSIHRIRTHTYHIIDYTYHYSFTVYINETKCINDTFINKICNTSQTWYKWVFTLWLMISKYMYMQLHVQ